MKPRKKSFSHRLTVSCLTFTLIPLLVFLAIYSALLSGLLRRNLQQDFDSRTKMVATQLDELYAQMSFISLELLNRSDFFSAIKQLYYNSADPLRLTEHYYAVMDSMINYSYFQTTFRILYLDARGYYYDTDVPLGSRRTVTRVPEEELAGYPWLAQADAAGGRAVQLNLGSNSMTRSDEPALSIVRALSAPTDTIGYLIVQVDIQERAYLFDALAADGAAFGLYSQAGDLLYAAGDFPDWDGDQALAALETPEAVNGYTLSSFRGGDTGCLAVALFPNAILVEELLGNLLPMLLVAALLLAMTVAWILMFTRRFSQPLTRLTQLMRETTIDNLEQPQALAPEPVDDEIEYLNQSYLKMRDRLHTMIHEKMAYVTRQAEQRYQFLQYQINPHFLYNTLNVIGIMGMEAGHWRIHQACQMLAKLLRYSLQDYRKGTTFQEEIDTIHTYLELMKMRFEHKIFFLVNFDEELGPYRLPRFTLQPFVENVFEHAFDADHRVVTLVVQADVHRDEWRLTISDDGRGISEADVRRIRQAVDEFSANGREPPTLQGGIGIQNTLVRLHMFFHGQFSYDIANNASGGCRITLRGALTGGEKP